MTQSSNIILAIKDLSLKYRTRSGLFKRFEHTALNDICFEIQRGETLGVLGRNGCGKSSLLRLLAGIIEPTAGRVECARGTTRALLTLGLGFRPDLSGRNNALLGAMLQGVTKRDALRALDEINEFAELGEFFDQPVKTYSAGMRARLGFAAALKTHVDILLIDEVLSVGDAHFRTKAQAAMLEKINGEQTIVFVSHNPQQVDKVCDRAIWIEKGRISAEGETVEVGQAYNRFMRELDQANKPERPWLVPVSEDKGGEASKAKGQG